MPYDCVVTACSQHPSKTVTLLKFLKDLKPHEQWSNECKGHQQTAHRSHRLCSAVFNTQRIFESKPEVKAELRLKHDHNPDEAFRSIPNFFSRKIYIFCSMICFLRWICHPFCQWPHSFCLYESLFWGRLETFSLLRSFIFFRLATLKLMKSWNGDEN